MKYLDLLKQEETRNVSGDGSGRFVSTPTKESEKSIGFDEVQKSSSGPPPKLTELQNIPIAADDSLTKLPEPFHLSETQKQEQLSYRTACAMVCRAAQRYGVDLSLAMGFFTSLDWYELAHGQITDDSLDTVMADIAQREDLQERLREERQP